MSMSYVIVDYNGMLASHADTKWMSLRRAFKCFEDLQKAWKMFSEFGRKLSTFS